MQTTYNPEHLAQAAASLISHLKRLSEALRERERLRLVEERQAKLRALTGE